MIKKATTDVVNQTLGLAVVVTLDVMVNVVAVIPVTIITGIVRVVIGSVLQRQHLVIVIQGVILVILAILGPIDVIVIIQDIILAVLVITNVMAKLRHVHVTLDAMKNLSNVHAIKNAMVFKAVKHVTGATCIHLVIVTECVTKKTAVNVIEWNTSSHGKYQ